MQVRPLSTLAVVALLLLAGCAGGMTDTTTGPSTGSDAPAENQNTVNFYVSDERNAIGDFAHLNVTIDAVAFHAADETGDDETADANATTAANATTDANATDVTTVATTTANASTTTAGNTSTTTVSNGTATATTTADANTTATGDATATAGTTVAATTATNDTAGAANESDLGGLPGGDGWHRVDVADRTVDLTELQGANATLLATFDVPAGDYDQVVVHVSSIEATLTDGEQVRVKLPSDRLKLNKGLTLGANETTDFVFDVTVFEAGNSGKYVLKPVVSQSGTDVPIERVDDRDDRRDRTEADLSAQIRGPVRAGENLTLRVRRGGAPVANATVERANETLGVTGADGLLVLRAPNQSTLALTVTAGNDTATFEWQVAAGGGGGGGGDGERDGERGDGAGRNDDTDRGADRTDRRDGERRGGR